jgi:hypothetical protein
MIQDWLKRLRAFWSAGRRNQIIVATSVVVLLAIIWGSVALANRGGTPSGNIAQATATPAPQGTASPVGTPQPTATATAVSTPLPTKPVNKAFVGGTQAGFTAIYGKPTATGVDSGNNLPTVTYRGTGPIGLITIELDGLHTYVVGIVVTAAKNSPWDAVTVNAVCPEFVPPDATFDTAQSITNNSNQDVALYQIGHSPTLASSLPAGVFTDNQNAPVKAGTFTNEIYYIDGSSGKLAYACSQRLGSQPTSPST